MIRKAATAKKRKASSAFKAKREEWSAVKGIAPERDPEYLAFLRSCPCLICGTWQNVTAAHTGDHAMGQKAPDRDAIPLCNNKCHQEGRYSYHKLGARKFWEHHKLIREQTIAAYRLAYGMTRTIQGKDSNN